MARERTSSEQWEPSARCTSVHMCGRTMSEPGPFSVDIGTLTGDSGELRLLRSWAVRSIGSAIADDETNSKVNSVPIYAYSAHRNDRPTRRPQSRATGGCNSRIHSKRMARAARPAFAGCDKRNLRPPLDYFESLFRRHRRNHFAFVQKSYNEIELLVGVHCPNIVAVSKK